MWSRRYSMMAAACNCTAALVIDTLSRAKQRCDSFPTGACAVRNRGASAGTLRRARPREVHAPSGRQAGPSFGLGYLQRMKVQPEGAHCAHGTWVRRLRRYCCGLGRLRSIVRSGHQLNDGMQV